MIQQEFKEEWKGRIVSNNKNEVSKVSIRILENVSRIKVFQVHDQSNDPSVKSIKRDTIVYIQPFEFGQSRKIFQS